MNVLLNYELESEGMTMKYLFWSENFAFFIGIFILTMNFGDC